MTKRTLFFLSCLAIALASLAWRGPAVSAQTSIQVCGVVTNYTAAGALTPGTITVAGVAYPIAAGASVSGTNLIAPGVNLCLSANLNALGLVTSGGLILNPATTTINVCGVVTAISSSAITIGGVTYPIAPGTVLSG